MAGILTMTDLPRDLREWNRVFAPLNQALQRVQVAGETAVVADFDGKMAIKVDGTLIAADYSLNLISGSKINLSGVAGSGVVDVTIALQALVDADIPASIARDSEVTAAANAAQSAAEATAAAALTAHEVASDPHPGYTTAAELASALSALSLASGTYTPTLTNVANLDGSTAFLCQYLRVGSVVTVSGKVSVNPTAGAASTQLGISLPIASNFGAAEDCGGCAFATAIAGQGAAILADAANNRAQLQFLSADTTDQPMHFSFQYRVI